MAHQVYRLLQSIYNSPQLITASGLEPIVEYLQHRNSPVFAIVAEAKTAKDKKAETVGAIGEIIVDGAITYKPVDAMCAPEGTSYTGILNQAAELISLGAKTIIMTFSSPGGQAAHCFTTCEALREMADENGVTLISYIDEYAASAALALSVIADEVIIHPSASTGSIGCVICLADKSKMLADAGIKPIYITSTPGKAPFSADGSFSEGFLADMQESVTRLGNEFATHVSKYTGVPFEDIIAMDAKMFHAERAVEMGLANKVMDHKQFAAHVAALTKGK